MGCSAHHLAEERSYVNGLLRLPACPPRPRKFGNLRAGSVVVVFEGHGVVGLKLAAHLTIVEPAQNRRRAVMVETVVSHLVKHHFGQRRRPVFARLLRWPDFPAWKRAESSGWIVTA